MRVSLITLHTVSNYGSCLQAYATQTMMEHLGHQVEIVDYYRKNNQMPSKIEQMFEGNALGHLSALWDKAPWLKRGLSKPIAAYIHSHDRRFDEFRLRYLHLSRQYLDAAQLISDPPIADVYCTGSDQVWNSIWNEGFEGPYFLDFAPDGKRRIAFSASIGREEIDDWEIPLMRDALAKYYAISMRETSGVELVKRLGFSDVQLVLDPTLLLSRESWGKIATHPKQIDGPYALIYQLNDNPMMLAFAAEVAGELGLKLVKISYRPFDIPRVGVNVVVPDVTDFIGLFESASYVVTDSFHATAFALNFGVPFTAVAPPRFGTRIASILSLTHTQERQLVNYGDLSMAKEPIDFSAVHSILEKNRDASISFLRYALS
ncbi:MAG: polysaccharide pyruvyl transferase family protein [Coriobacteriaceae bacterium]|nr:polysaccharide pyruvyl transferase family protein [Coriobacteriaceae bacterium]